MNEVVSRDMLGRLGSPAFAPEERRLLRSEPGISDGVIARLELVGIHSIAGMRNVGAERLVQMVVESTGSVAWRNRRRALERILSRATTRVD